MTVHAQTIHAAIFSRLQTIKGFKTYRQTPMLMLMPELTPALSVYMLRERMTADGNYNAGEPRFEHLVIFGIAASVVLSNDDEQLARLYGKMDEIFPLLLSDPTFIHLIEGFPSIDTKLVFSQVGETAYAEAQMEFGVAFRTMWEPNVPDYLKVIHLETSYGTDDTPQVVIETDIPQE